MKNRNPFVPVILIFGMSLSSAAAGIAPDVDQIQRPIFLPGASSIRKIKWPGSDGGPQLAPKPPNAAIVGKLQSNYFSEKLVSLSQFDSMASLSEGLVKGAAVKFAIDNRKQPAKIYFINGNYTESDDSRPQYVQYHYYFLQKHLGIKTAPDSFNKMTYFTNDLEEKKFIAGTLQRYERAGITGPQIFFGIQFYPQDHIAEQTLLFALKTIRKALDPSFDNLAFVSYGSQQTMSGIVTASNDLKIKLTTVEQVYAGIPYIPMNLGKTYGFLKIVKNLGEVKELTPMDIAVFKELPLDLSVVSGVITTVIQDAGAHVNLKSKERNTPNMVLRDLAEIKKLEMLDGEPVEMSVENETFKIVKTDIDVKKYHEQKEALKPNYVIENGTANEVLLFDEMAEKYTPLELIKSSISYGGKASKLPLLAHKNIAGLGSIIEKLLGYRLTPMGYSIPITYYFDFVKANPELNEELQNLIRREMSEDGLKPPSPKERAELVEKIQKLFFAAKIPNDLFEQLGPKSLDLQKQVLGAYPKSPLKKVKVRSSSNAEDIPQFDGAGLHSSYSAEIGQIGEADTTCKRKISLYGVTTKETMKPDTLSCAIKGVYASLWNQRAIEERNFARINQHSVGMALAVNMSYDFRDDSEGIDEIGNAVIVTRVINSKGVYGYRLSLNTDDNLVTNPTPNTQSEILIASFLEFKEDPKFSFMQFAKTNPKSEAKTAPMFGDNIYKTLIRVAQRVELNYCKNNPNYYPGGDCNWITGDLERPTSLDMEFKIYSNGEVLIKQVREFSGK
jgi:hypothetical protein